MIVGISAADPPAAIVPRRAWILIVARPRPRRVRATSGIAPVERAGIAVVAVEWHAGDTPGLGVALFNTAADVSVVAVDRGAAEAEAVGAEVIHRARIVVVADHGHRGASRRWVATVDCARITVVT